MTPFAARIHQPFPHTHRQHPARTPGGRESAAKRGYGRRWQRLRIMVLRRFPMCQVQGCPRAAVDVHHREAKRAGGRDSFENLVALCHECHSAITGGRRLTIKGMTAE